MEFISQFSELKCGRYWFLSWFCLLEIQTNYKKNWVWKEKKSVSEPSMCSHLDTGYTSCTQGFVHCSSIWCYCWCVLFIHFGNLFFPPSVRPIRTIFVLYLFHLLVLLSHSVRPLSSHSVHPLSTTVFVCFVCPLGIDLGFSLLVWYCCLVLFIHLGMFFIHVGTDVAFCSSICNCFSCATHPFGLCCCVLFVHLPLFSYANHPFGLCCRVLFVHVELFLCVIRPFGLCCRVLFVHWQLFFMCYSSIWSLLSCSVHPFGTISCVIRPFGLCCRVLFIHLELFSCAVRPFGLCCRVLSVHLRTIFVLCSSVLAGFSVVGSSSEARDLSSLDVRKFCCLVPHSLISLSLSLSLFPFPLLLRGSSVLLDMVHMKKRSATWEWETKREREREKTMK